MTAHECHPDCRAHPLADAIEEFLTNDPVEHPGHYTSHPSGIEVIEITRHMGFCLGNVVKYVLRADLKGNAIEDLRKARQYLDFEIETRLRAGKE